MARLQFTHTIDAGDSCGSAASTRQGLYRRNYAYDERIDKEMLVVSKKNTKNRAKTLISTDVVLSVSKERNPVLKNKGDAQNLCRIGHQ